MTAPFATMCYVLIADAVHSNTKKHGDDRDVTPLWRIGIVDFSIIYSAARAHRTSA